jgi:hypothetical protein
MTTTEQVLAELSTGARSALINAGSSATGTEVLAAGIAPAIFVELAEWGLVGPNDGLTRQGSIVRQRLIDLALESAFG